MSGRIVHAYGSFCQEWTNHRITKSSSFVNFVQELGFNLNLQEGEGAPEQGPWPLRAPGVFLEFLEPRLETRLDFLEPRLEAPRAP